VGRCARGSLGRGRDDARERREKEGVEQGRRQRTTIAAMPEVGKMTTVAYYLGENGG
jgi:hypothetical protein